MPLTSLLLFSLVTGGLSVQTWLEQPASAFVNPGGVVELACRINNMKGDCRWEQRKEDGQVQPLGFYPGKREWSGDRGAGDCSIRIMDAEFEYDNGKYVCQVTASGFKATDTLISHEAILSVRVPPTSVELRSEAGPVKEVVSGVAGEEVEVECVVEGGNPSPNLHWYLGRRRLGADTVMEDQRQGSVSSRLVLRVEKENSGQPLRCVVEHSALQTDMEASALLDIHYAPEVSVRPEDREVSAVEGETVSLECLVSSSPAASVVWRHQETGDILSHSQQLHLPAISRSRAGRYVCQATNKVGTSQSEETQIEVKFGASLVTVSPSAGTVDKLLGSSLELSCQAEASPAPAFRWVQHTARGAVTISHQQTVRLEEVRYEDQGQYYCEASNAISTSRSEAVSLSVTGPPRVNTHNKHLFLTEGSDAKIEVEFCGSPLPKQTWQIESQENKLSLVAGTSHDTYTVEKERNSATNNCYVSVLHILSIDQEKARRNYVLKLENEHGEELHRARVTVGEEISKQTLIGSLVGVAVTFLLVLCLTVCWCRRCCRSDKQLKPDPERPL